MKITVFQLIYSICIFTILTIAYANSGYNSILAVSFGKEVSPEKTNYLYQHKARENSVLKATQYLNEGSLQ